MVVHPLLARQLRRLGIEASSPPPDTESWARLLERVSKAYEQADGDHDLADRSMNLAMSEMRELQSRVVAERDTLAASEERFRLLADATAEGVLVHVDGRLLDANRAAASMFGLETEALDGLLFDDLVAPESHQDAMAHVEDASLGPVEVACLRAGGDRFPARLVGRPISFQGGKAHIVLVTDQSEAEAAEAALGRSRERFRLAFEHAPVGMALLATDGRVVRANAALEEALGASRDALEGVEIARRLEQDAPPGFDEQLAAALQDVDGRFCSSGRHTRADGSSGSHRADVSLARDSRGTPLYFVLHFEDLTEAQRLETELRQAQKLEAIGRLAAGIAHEINTPTQFIGDNITYLRDVFADLLKLLDDYRGEFGALAEAEERIGFDELAEDVPQAIGETLEGVGRVASIVSAMKSFAHPDSGEQESADLNRALVDTVTVARNELRYVADVVFELGDIPPVVCHLGALNQVFLNLLVNAGHAIEDCARERGVITVSTSRRDEATVAVCVADTGCGIPAEVHERMFDPFFTTKEVGRGTGQGLALARRVVEQHGGTIVCTSTVGAGTEFELRLPVLGPGAASGS